MEGFSRHSIRAASWRQPEMEEPGKGGQSHLQHNIRGSRPRNTQRHPGKAHRIAACCSQHQSAICSSVWGILKSRVGRDGGHTVLRSAISCLSISPIVLHHRHWTGVLHYLESKTFRQIKFGRKVVGAEGSPRAWSGLCPAAVPSSSAPGK